mgnify:CR=1 FL=1
MSGALLLYALTGKQYKTNNFIIIVMTVLLITGIPFFLYLLNTGYSNTPGKLTACESNLKNIATALEMYATDNKRIISHP